MLWYQKARTKWIACGDKKTRFYKTLAVSKRRRNKVLCLKDDLNEWCHNQEELGRLATNHFKSLYSAEVTVSYIPNSILGFPSTLSDNSHIFSPIIDEGEIKEALFSMGSSKAPGPDGYNPGFFKKMWPILKDPIIQLVQNIFTTGSVPTLLNETLITLIPKVPNPETLSQFRPISLCNTLYKLIPKIVVNRLKPYLDDLISPNQCSFVAGRQGIDNVIITKEILHHFKTRKSKNGAMIWKIDLEKAYDRISWDFLRNVLTELGLPTLWCNLIMSCVESSSFSVLWNGDKMQPFKPSRGIRQASGGYPPTSLYSVHGKIGSLDY